MPTDLGPVAIVIHFQGNSIIYTPLTKALSYVLTGFEMRQTSNLWSNNGHSPF